MLATEPDGSSLFSGFYNRMKDQGLESVLMPNGKALGMSDYGAHLKFGGFFNWSTLSKLTGLTDENWWNYILDFYSTMIWQIITIICVWLLFITSTVIQSLKFKTINTQLFLLTLSIALVFITHYSNKKNLEISAIILSSTVKVASAPTSNAKKLFLIHSGTKVKIKDQIDNWINVEFSNGNNGWIQESSCRVIN